MPAWHILAVLVNQVGVRTHKRQKKENSRWSWESEDQQGQDWKCEVFVCTCVWWGGERACIPHTAVSNHHVHSTNIHGATTGVGYLEGCRNKPGRVHPLSSFPGDSLNHKSAGNRGSEQSTGDLELGHEC